MYYDSNNIDREISIPVWPDSFFLEMKKKPITGQYVGIRSGLPKPTTCFVGRVLNHKYLFNEYFQKNKKQKNYGPNLNTEIRVSTSEGRRLILFYLNEGEKLAFDIRFLTGFSSTIKFQMAYNFSLTGYTIQRNFVSIATGPGKILFETNGKPTIIEKTNKKTVYHTNDPHSIFYPYRMIAWSEQVQFQFDSIYRWYDIYLNDVRIQSSPKPGEIVLLDADTSNYRRNTAWFLNMIKNIYWPF